MDALISLGIIIVIISDSGCLARYSFKDYRPKVKEISPENYTIEYKETDIL